MDDFRKIQKAMCRNGGGSKAIYGCSCCRDIGNLNLFKKWSRDLAKARLREQSKKLIDQMIQEAE